MCHRQTRARRKSLLPLSSLRNSCLARTNRPKMLPQNRSCLIPFYGGSSKSWNVLFFYTPEDTGTLTKRGQQVLLPPHGHSEDWDRESLLFLENTHLVSKLGCPQGVVLAPLSASLSIKMWLAQEPFKGSLPGGLAWTQVWEAVRGGLS